MSSEAGTPHPPGTTGGPQPQREGETTFGIFSFYDMGTHFLPNKSDGNTPQPTPRARPLRAREGWVCPGAAGGPGHSPQAEGTRSLQVTPGPPRPTALPWAATSAEGPAQGHAGIHPGHVSTTSLGAQLRSGTAPGGVSIRLPGCRRLVFNLPRGVYTSHRMGTTGS